MRYVKILHAGDSAIYRYNESGEYSFTKIFGDFILLEEYGPPLNFEKAVEYATKHNDRCEILTQEEINNLKVELL